MYTRACELWLPGPVKSDPYCRAVGFDSSVESHIDVRFDPQIVPQTFEEHYTIELFAKLTGGADSVRALYGSGRYSLFVSRDGWLVVTVVDGLSGDSTLCALVS